VLIEEVALEPPFGLRDRARLRELDREQAQRVSGHDPVERRRLLRRAHREERFDAALRAHRLDPHVVALIEHREREGRGLRPGRADLIPDPFATDHRLGLGRGERHAVQVQEHRPSLHDIGQRSRDPLDAGAVEHGPR
jgi:hypothetical protein